MLRNGLNSRRPKRTPLLFVRQHKEKENSFWERVLWTDESKIELFGHNYRNHGVRKNGEAYLPRNTVPTVKFGGGSILILGCFSANGGSKISVIDSKMPKIINRSCEKISCLMLRVLSYLLITFSGRIMISRIHLNLWRSSCLKIMLMFCNGQVSPRISIQLGTCGDFWKFKSEKEYQQTSIIWRQL